MASKIYNIELPKKVAEILLSGVNDGRSNKKKHQEIKNKKLKQTTELLLYDQEYMAEKLQTFVIFLDIIWYGL